MNRKQTVLEKVPALGHLFGIRHRYVFTRNNRMRLRYMISSVAVIAAVGFSVLPIPVKGNWYYSDVQHLADAASGHFSDSASSSRRVLPGNFLELVSFAPSGKKKKPDNLKTFKIESGDTVAGILQSAGVPGTDAYKIVSTLGEYVDVRKIRAGQSFKAKIKQSEDDGSISLAEMKMDIDPLKSLKIFKEGDEYVAKVKEKEVSQHSYAGATQIETSLYGSAARSGIPAPVIARLIKMYSWSVDFQRDIRRDDRIEVLYDVYETDDGKAVRYGDIHYANLNLGGIDLQLYRFEDKDGNTGYYDSLGRSVKKTLMRTPVDGARVSSGFGMRHHPILGYNKMHKGVDFAASLGTPLYAAGDGVLEFAGRNGGYGNFIRIRHTSSMKTAYAHLHKFAKGIGQGKRVKQGDLIGYVGSTGRSTGPHLHYEVLLDGKQVNPNRIDLPIGENLKGKDLEKFKTAKRALEQRYVELKGMQFASMDEKDKDKKAG